MIIAAPRADACTRLSDIEKIDILRKLYIGDYKVGWVGERGIKTTCHHSGCKENTKGVTNQQHVTF